MEQLATNNVPIDTPRLTNHQFVIALATAVVALVLSAVILIAGYCLFSPDLQAYKAEATRDKIRPWTINGADLVTRRGSAESLEDKSLRITGLEKGQDTRGIFTRRTSLKAADYPYLEYATTNRNAKGYFYFIWRRQDNPDKTYSATMHWKGDSATTLDLARHPQWSGKIVEVGVDIYGSLRDQPPTISYLQLKPANAMSLINSTTTEWFAFQEWTQKSAHHLRGTPDIPILAPTLVGAVWASLAMILLGLMRLTPATPGKVAFLTAVVIPWIALDMMWQFGLEKRLGEARYLFADKSQHDKHLADWNAGLYQYTDYLKREVLPEPGTRIFLLHDSKHRTFYRLKAQFYLLPHNLYNYDRYPQPSKAQVGNYILVLGTIPGLSFQQTTGQLSWKGQSLAAREVDKHALGTVYQLVEETKVEGAHD